MALSITAAAWATVGERARKPELNWFVKAACTSLPPRVFRCRDAPPLARCVIQSVSYPVCLEDLSRVRATPGQGMELLSHLTAAPRALAFWL